jgi:hypothetical protein
MPGITNLLESQNDICGLRIHEGGKMATRSKYQVHNFLIEKDSEYLPQLT